MNLLPILRHCRKVLEHKWHVYKCGRLLRVPLARLLAHDLSKFSKIERIGYAANFFGGTAPDGAFKRAWAHHCAENDHHPEHWADKRGGMPDVAIREMVADWFAASRAYDGKYPTDFESWGWWNTAGKKLRECKLTVSDTREAKDYAEQLMLSLEHGGRIPQWRIAPV